MHCVHHLFPTVDQSKLHLLIPVFKQTCREFFITDPADAAAGAREDILRTDLFLRLRQITTFGGWWAMCRQVSAVQ